MVLSRMHANQGGSTTSFLLVGVAFVIMVAGGLYVLKNREGATNKTASPSASHTPSPTAQKEHKKVAVPTPKPSHHADGKPSNHNVARHQSEPSAPLPTTGPSDAPLTIALSAVLTGTVAAYLQSRKYRAELLRR